MPSPIANTGRRHRRKPMAEINVVPYIDVMLVLLVIFMVTAPLLYQAVDIDLPQVAAAPLPQENQEPLIVNVDADGNYSFGVGTEEPRKVSGEQLMASVSSIMRQRPETQVMVRGDEAVPYGKVVEVMSRLQGAGVPKVGLMTQPPPSH